MDIYMCVCVELYTSKEQEKIKQKQQDIDLYIIILNNNIMENTKLGPATYLNTREDGVRILELSWELANNSKAILYTKEINLVKTVKFGGKLGEMTFQNKEECWSYMRALRDSLIRGATVDGKAATVLKALLEKHPKYLEKIGCGFASFKYDEHPEYTGTMCFFIVRTDGTCEDFSFRKCLDVVFGTQSRKKTPRSTDRRDNKRKFKAPVMKPGTVLKVDGLDDLKKKGVDIHFSQIKEAFGAAGKVEFVEMFENHAEVRFSEVENAKKACEDIKDINGEQIFVSMLPEEEEKKHFERSIEMKKQSKNRKQGGGRGRFGKGKGRRGGNFNRRR